jgi:dihydroorotate dehydrogenase
VIRNEERYEPGIVGVNLGKNKSSSDAAVDFVHGIETFGTVADYIVLNISSPNTEGLRDLQHKQHLEKLISKAVVARDKLTGKKPPLLVKISPDLSTQQKEDIATVLSKKECRVDGLIVSNTTISRPDTLRSANKDELGGLSGEPLKNIATNTIRDMYRLTKGQVPIIGVGGISSGQDAYDKIRAGASLIQLYTSMVYEGPPVVRRVTNELAELLRKDGYQNVSEAVGADVKKQS